jgi:hypothetical protein
MTIMTTFQMNHYSICRYLPNHDDGKVEDVPTVFEVSVGVCDEPIGHDLHAALASEDHREDHFYRLLRETITP